MRARIHRGAREIGGNCVELEAAGERLLLDLGRPLDVDPDEPVSPPDVRGLVSPDEGSLLGVILSHPHRDHYGLVLRAHPTVPIYVGQAAAAVLDAAAFFSPSGIRLRPPGFLEDRRPFTVGPFTVTPYLVDHSAFDSYALLIEAGRRRLFYSGDFRMHGRKTAVMRDLLDRPPKGVNALILEGTHVGRDAAAGVGLDESAVELAMADVFCETSGVSLVFSSSQNVDRLVTVYRACKRAKRTLVVDLYAATIAAATGRATIPKPGFPRLRLYVPQRQRVAVKEAGEFERVDAIREYRIFRDEIRARAGELVMLIQGSTLPELLRSGCLVSARAIWSLWSGYLDQPPSRRTARLLDDARVPFVRLHALGHARIEDLQALANVLSPARVVPIHTSAP